MTPISSGERQDNPISRVTILLETYNGGSRQSDDSYRDLYPNFQNVTLDGKRNFADMTKGIDLEIGR